MGLGSIIFLVLIVGGISANAFECDSKYSKLSLEHTMCIDPKSIKDCEIIERGINDDDKVKLVQLHNEIRSKVATGKEGLPEAADMLEMVWDDELAQVAQRLVETCKFEHDCRDCRAVERFISVGQNLAQRSPQEKDWEGFMNQFLKEKESFSRDENVINRFSNSNKIGHYSQLVWSESYKVGCGWAYYKSGSENWSYLACNYGPAGNMNGGVIYKKGAPCSSCPENSCCGKTCADSNIKSKYEGLCSMIEQ